MSTNETLQISYDNLNVQSCFKNFYVVPDYQREYVWEETEVAQLLEDLIEAYAGNPNKQYFLGSIVVYKKPNGEFELIDGQQRTTTFFLMLCAFRQVAAERGIDFGSPLSNMIFDEQFDENAQPIARYRLELQYEDAKDCIRTIAEKTERPQSGKISASGERMFEAYDNIVTTLNDMFKDESSFRKFFLFFINKAIFIQIGTSEIGDALKIFETINQRGVGLNPIDLLKNLIFRQVDRSQFKVLNLKWKEIVDGLDKAGEKPLRFIRYFIMANYEVDSSKYRDGIVREDDIYSWFVNNNDKCRYKEEPLAFVNLLRDCQMDYVNYINGRDSYGENIYLQDIKYLGGGAYKYHLMLLLPARGMPKELFAHLSKQVETVIYYVIMTKQSNNELERQFAQWSAQIRKIKTKDELNSFVDANIAPAVQIWKSTYKNWFMDVSQKNMQQYRIRYLLAKTAQYMDMQKQGSPTYGSLSQYIKAGIDLEHILPFSPNEMLIDKYPDTKLYDMIKSKLGNLTLLEKVPNIVIGNNDFYTVKRPGYEASALYLTRSISCLDDIGVNNLLTKLNSRIQTWDRWDEDTISERQEILYELSHSIWEIKSLT